MNPTVSIDTELLGDMFFTGYSVADLSAYERTFRSIGTKSMPVTHGGFQIHPDGAGIEFAPLRPLRGMTEVINAVNDARRIIDDLLARNGASFGTHVGTEHYIQIDHASFDVMAKHAPYVLGSIMEAGCSPDYRNGVRRETPRGYLEGPYRCAGNHYHIDLRPEYCNDAASCADIAAELDEVFSLPLAQYAAGPDLWYRKPGVYRPKPYGIEYRSLGTDTASPAMLELTTARLFDWLRSHHRVAA